MTTTTRLFFGSVLLFVALLARAEDAVMPTAELIKQAQQVARSGKVDETRAAYEKVFAATDVTMEQQVAAHLDIARVLLRGSSPRTDQAVAEYDKALALAALPDKDRFETLMAKAAALYRSNFVDRRGSYHTRGIDAAMDIYRKVSASGQAGNATRITAYDRLADCLLDKMQEAEAATVLHAALQIPGLSAEEKDTAEFNLGRCMRRQGNEAEAREVYDRLLASTANAGLKNQIVTDYTHIFSDNGDLAAGEAFLRKHGKSDMDVAAFLSRYGEGDRATELYLGILKDRSNDDRTRWNAFAALTRGSDYGRILAWGQKYLDPFMETDAKRVTYLLGYFSRSHMGPYYAQRDSRSHPAFLVWAAEKLLAYEELKEGDRVNVIKHLVNAHLDLNHRAEAAAAARQLASHEACAPAVAEQYRLIAEIIDRKAEPKSIRKMADAWMEHCRKDGETELERAELLGEVAKIAVRACNEAAAEAIDSVRAPLIQVEPRRSLKCEFVEEAPRDISAWLASSVIRKKGRYGVMDRKYGNNLKDLVATDAAITDRVTGAGSRGDRRARFSVLCDAEGLHFFLLAPCGDLGNVADGLEATSSYEIYFAAGRNEPYYCFIVNPGQQRFSDSFHTMYRNRYHRRITIEDETLFTDSRVTPEGMATYFRIRWAALYDRLPQRGETYEFECIYWASGGRSWGGSKSVHNRSSFGDLVFSDISARDLVAVKRRVLKTAYDHYRGQKNGSRNGVVDFWEDPELGDPTFYDACLRELVGELDEYGRMVKPDMTDADVEMLFAEAVPKWMEIEYVVADLRVRYMEDELFAEE